MSTPCSSGSDFESQGPKLGLPRTDQNLRASILRWIGVNAAPTTAMVIAHLRHCARTGEASQRGGLPSSRRDEGLPTRHAACAGEPCIQVGPGEFVEPDAVFWTDAGLGQWAHQLPHGHRAYQQFFDLVGVQDTPRPTQVEGILRRDQPSNRERRAQRRRSQLSSIAAGNCSTSSSPIRSRGRTP